MSNPNLPSQESKNSPAKTDWEGVASQADKKDWTSENNENNQQKSEKTQEEQLSRLAALRQRIKELAQPSTQEFSKVNERPELTKEQIVAKKEQANQERIDNFVEKLSQDSLSKFCFKEIARVQKLERRLDKYAENKDHTFMEKRQHDKEVQELKRYGYEAGTHHEDSNRFRELKKLSQEYGVSPQDRIEYGERRARDYKAIEIYLNSENGRKIKKELREKGYKNIPEKWDDDTLTTHEMHEMADFVKFRSNVHEGLYD